MKESDVVKDAKIAEKEVNDYFLLVSGYLIISEWSELGECDEH